MNLIELALDAVRNDDQERAIKLLTEALADQFRDATKMVAEPVKKEPVAWIEPDGTPSKYNHSTGMKPLYAAPVDAKAIDFDTWMKHPYTIELNKRVKEDYIPATDAKAIRAEALEEAAKVCDDESRYSNDAECCAAAIRGLK